MARPESLLALFRAPLGFSVLAAFAVLACSPRADDVRVDDRPADTLRGRDLILVTVDTLRMDAVGVYLDAAPGASPTPVVDELARGGVVFTQATTPFPRTTPALASLLTGRTPKHHGSREVGQAVAEHVPFLSQILSRIGYRSVAVTGNRAAGDHQGFDRGFDVFEVVPGAKPAAGEVTDAALHALSDLPAKPVGEGPVFLWVHYVDPHFPYAPPGASDDACGEVAELYEEHPTWVFADRDGVGRRSLESCRRRYLGEVRRADAEIGRLLAGLQELGRPPREALVVFTSDHGENQGEDGFFYEHGPSLHDASLRVPLIVSAPGLEPRTDRLPIRLEDLPPTLARLLGVAEDELPPMDGRNFARRLWLGSEVGAEVEVVSVAESGSVLHRRFFDAVVTGRADKHCVHDGRWSLCGSGDDKSTFGLFDHEADPLLETDVAEGHPEVFRRLLRQRRTWPPESARLRSARDGRFKLVEIPRRDGGWKRVLYDLDNDPTETRDVAARRPDVVERLGRVLEAYVEDLPTPGEVVRDDEELAALRALGYVE